MWAIVSMQRAGTHLLASLLDSHPSLKSYGEVLHIKEPLFQWNLGEYEGIVAMYSQVIRSNAYDLIRDAKIIHLTRNLDDNAYSWALLVRRAPMGLKYWPLSHEVQRVKVPSIPLSEIEQRRKEILAYRKEVMSGLKDSDIFEITYEYICGGNKEIAGLSKEKASPILEFLEVEPVELTTGLRKVRYENSNRL
jgi:hypothetical protein